MKKFKIHLAEAKKSTVVVSFGRMNPMTNGHEKLANKLKSEAASRSADAKLYLSHSTNPKKDPLPFDAKVKFAKKAFGPMVQNSAARTIIEVAKELTGKYSNLVVVVGSDRVPEFRTLLEKYNGKDFTFDSIEIVSAGERDPDAEGVEGMSGSKMRKFAADEDFASFRKGVPSKLTDADAKGLFDAVRKGMKLDESVELDEGERVSADYKVSKSGRKYPAHRIVFGKKRKEDDEESEEDDKEDVKEAVLNYSQRMMRATRFKRLQKRVQRARTLAMRRYANPERLKQRSLKMARNFLRMHMAGGKQYSNLSTGEKISVDTRMQRLAPVIKKLAARLMPTVRQKETLRHVVGSSVKEETQINELAYQGNIGAMEMFAFFQKATDEQKKQMKALIGAGKDREAWKLIHKVTGVKLVGPQFEQYLMEQEEEEEDETEIDGLEMIQIELRAMIEDARSLLVTISNMEEEPEAWVQSKVSLATDYIASVKDYLEFSDEEEEEDDDDESEDDYAAAEDAMYGMETEGFDADLEHIVETLNALHKKSEKSGIDYSTIREVYLRGLQSYDESASMTPQQWAFARVNSFVSGGATIKHDDADLWESAQRNTKFSHFAEGVLEYGTDAARLAYARATPGQSQEITMARYSADKALEAINSANLQRAFKLYSEEACCDECQDEIVEEVDWDLVLHEAQYQGKDVTLNKPFYTPDGPKKSAVYTMGPNDKVVIVRFGDPNMEIKKDNPERRKSFRARHNCDEPGPKWKAKYWSCAAW
jgi:hypothetical protein